MRKEGAGMSSIAELRSPRHLAAAGEREAGLLDDLDDVARLYVEEAVRVRRIVRMSVTAPPAVIEDACQIAWGRLLIHRERRERSLEALLEQRGRSAVDGSADAGMTLPTPPLIEDLVEQKNRLE